MSRTLVRLLIVVVLVPVAIVLVALSVANRNAVTLSLDPFNPAAPALAASLPLYALLFAALGIGIIIGGVATWIGQGRWRRAARQARGEAKAARQELERRTAAHPGSPATALVRRNAA